MPEKNEIEGHPGILVLQCWPWEAWLTYHVNRGVLEFVLLFIVKDETVFLDERDHRSLPSWTFEESYKAVEEPVLLSQNCH